MNGRWFVRADGRRELRQALARARERPGDREPERRQDPADDERRPRPQRPGAAPARARPAPARLRPEAAAAARLLAYEPSVPVGEALLDQTLIAGIGNVIRIEACFLPGISPWRPVGELSRRRGPGDRRRRTAG